MTETHRGKTVVEIQTPFSLLILSIAPKCLLGMEGSRERTVATLMFLQHLLPWLAFWPCSAHSCTDKAVKTTCSRNTQLLPTAFRSGNHWLSQQDLISILNFSLGTPMLEWLLSLPGVGLPLYAHSVLCLCLPTMPHMPLPRSTGEPFALILRQVHPSRRK